MKVTLGKTIFASKNAAITFFKAHLVAGTVPEDALAAAIKQHPDAAAKMECFKRFLITIDPVWNTKCFAIESTNNTSEPFSIACCLSPPSHHHRNVKQARMDSYDQCKLFKASSYNKCAICNSSYRIEIDHVTKFSQLYKEWRKEETFSEYHQQHAVLQLLCRRCHADKTFGRVHPVSTEHSPSQYAFLD